ncbi:thiamine diphosphokinase [Thalassococcus sp. CAU 1522]|uniref:Thiamine diphosphokinase n=1 Tax=Thalassococcus arenae TaxID=2851652 RepID=A0ABS6N2N6_9RHOB|nr:thiamine diphosphokinase [Thalassococcus arenae]MBV2358280.1 thiamine diphosphokinase [Thalassococcus arenae]
MKDPIVHSESPVLLVGGGETHPNALISALSAFSPVIAADGGADAILQCGHVPDAVIGDLDSLSAEARAAIPGPAIHRIAEQDSTDFDKCLRNIVAPLVVAHGFLGRRLDHQLAAMSVLVRRPDRRCLLVGAQDVVALAPPRLRLDLPQNSRLSLFPLAQVAGRSAGLRWPIDGLTFHPDGVIGTSNAVTGPVSLEFEKPGMIVILPIAAEPVFRTALLTAPATWPARA